MAANIQKDKYLNTVYIVKIFMLRNFLEKTGLK